MGGGELTYPLLSVKRAAYIALGIVFLVVGGLVLLIFGGVALLASGVPDDGSEWWSWPVIIGGLLAGGALVAVSIWLFVEGGRRRGVSPSHGDPQSG